MSLNYLRDVIEKTIQFVKKGFKDLLTLYLYQFIIVLGFFLMIHQKFTYQYRIDKISLSEIDLFELIATWQTFVYIIIAVPLLIIINVFTVRLIEDQYNTNKKSFKYSLKNAGKYSFVFIIYYLLVFLLSLWTVKTLSLESIALKIFLLIILIPILLFTLTFLRFIPVKTLTSGKIIKSIKETWAFVKVNLSGSVTILLVTIGLYCAFETLIAVLEVNGAMLYENIIHTNVFLLILLIIVIFLKSAISYFIYLIDIRFILNPKPAKQITNNKK